MSLAEASEARKTRLLALRKRKEGQEVDDNRYVASDLVVAYFTEHTVWENSPLIKNRNFDPESRMLKKHNLDDPVMEDTLEIKAHGMAAQIIADDEKRRAQELVCYPVLMDRYCLFIIAGRF